MSIKSLLTAVSSVAVIALASGAHASSPGRQSPDSDQGSLRVSVADLDLSRPADGRIALRRIHAAADELCNGAPNPADLDRARVFRACVADVIDHTLAALDNPVLTALNAGAPVPELTASR